ncbi:MAG: carotenoid biosynthesis protein [Jiangellales bacterium]
MATRSSPHANRSAAPGDVAPASATRTLAGRLTIGLAVGGVLLQVAHPLLSGEPLRLATVGSVTLLATAAVVHAVTVRGWAWGVAMAATFGGLGLTVEAVGTATGFPFGTYSYTGTLGLEVLDVPVLVPMAWIMLGYPAFLAGQALGGRRWGWALGAWTLAAYDLFLDPQMVQAGHWTWDFPDPGLPGVPGIPLTNYAGWVFAAVVMMLTMTAIDRAVGRRRAVGGPGRLPHDLVPAAVLVWLYLSQVLANLVFFGRPAVAVWGGLLMGLTMVPYIRLLLRDRSVMR